MPRRMRDQAFREAQWDRRYEPQVEPLNRYIDELGERDDVGHPPYIAPMYRGIDAPVLSVFRDPGPKAGGPEGSGFLCVENDDPSAERLWHFLDEAGMDHRDVVPWNAYPWYINAKPSTAQLRDGVEPLRRVIELMPRLQVVILHGNDATRGWKMFLRQHAHVVRTRGIESLGTYHTSRGALRSNHSTVEERLVESRRREDHIRTTFAAAARILHSNARAPQ